VTARTAAEPWLIAFSAWASTSLTSRAHSLVQTAIPIKQCNVLDGFIAAATQRAAALFAFSLNIADLSRCE